MLMKQHGISSQNREIGTAADLLNDMMKTQNFIKQENGASDSR